MDRRAFLKIVGGCGVSLCFGRNTFAKDALLPSHFPGTPQTPFEAPSGSWTMVLLPDTQYYSMSYPEVYRRQTEWIAAHRQSHNILFVAHEGDIVHVSDIPEQWQNARRAMDVLNQAAVPYALLPGNHDLLRDKETNLHWRGTLLNDYFGEKDYAHSENFALFEPAKLENSWHTFASPSGKILVLALEYSPRDAVIAWARQAAADHPEHTAVLVTHAYMYNDDTRYDWQAFGDAQKWSPRNKYATLLEKEGGANDGKDLWDKLVKDTPNIRLVCNGHVLGDGTGYLVSANSAGHSVHQILANYQEGVEPDYGWGGGGYLRLMQFHPGHERVQIRSYSPWYDKWLTSRDQDFSLTLA